MIRLPAKVLKGLHNQYSGLDPVYGAKPLQLGMRRDPWRIMLVSFMRGDRTLIAALLMRLLQEYPNPFAMAQAEVFQLDQDLERLRNGTLAAKHMVDMSRVWVTKAWIDAKELPGVTRYVAECLALFCFNRLDCENIIVQGYVRRMHGEINYRSPRPTETRSDEPTDSGPATEE